MMNKTANILILVLLWSVTLTSCQKDEPVDAIVLPTNLTTTITVTNEIVDITATATNSNFYTFVFIQGNDSTKVESTDGNASHNFTSGGTHTIKTRAHTTYSDYIEKVETVTITLSGGNGTYPATGYTTPLSYPGLTLVWNDEFDGTSLSSDWTQEIGNGSWGWGNNELQYYRQENTEVANGYLTITAKQESFGGYDYTSSRIKTQAQKSFKYGRVDIRAAVPYGQGIWPALWMLGDNITSVGWPACGEIDIMELVGGSNLNDRTIHGTIHWDNAGTNANYGGSNSLASGKFADEFHVFSIIWDQNQIRWLRDDVQFHVADVSPAEMNEFQENFFFIFNVAVGGNWPGSPNASTIFPQKMHVDYVRVFQ